MRAACVRSCDRKNFIKAESTGVRSTFYYPGGGTYSGFWLNSQHQHYGVKESKENYIYDGGWLNGKRHGHGTMRKRLPDGTQQRIYIGEWRNNMKCGEGKQFYNDGVYYGFWRDNRRHGIGIKWFKDGSIYVGEWAADVKHGVGVFFCVNGNRYEGHYARGYKNGEGTFYHMHTGQIQKGMWEYDVCKTSMVQDDFRNQGDRPTEYPITQNHIENPDDFIRMIFQKHWNNANKPIKSIDELVCIDFVHKKKHNAKFEPRAVSNSLLSFDIDFPCTCCKKTT